jgi:hypothetical protein
MTDSIDLSWMNDIENTPTHFSKEHMQSIDLVFLYINVSNHIEKIINENHIIVKDGLFEKEALIKLIQDRRNPFPKTRYKLCDVLTFFVDVEPDGISDFIPESNTWCKSIPIIDDITIPPSVPLFHDINSIFIILKEMTAIQNKKPSAPPLPLLSILKSDSNKTNENKKTKRVRISSDLPERIHSKKTSKHRDS